MKRTCIQALVGVLFFAALVHLLNAELDCSMYPMYPLCCYEQPIFVFFYLSRVEAMSLKELYDDDEGGWKNRRRP
ncbi:unnamed protein product, partial [Ixodes hexagonus]